MSHAKPGILAAILVSSLSVAWPRAQIAADPQFTGDGQLVRPDYREWVYLSSGLGMTYSAGQPAANAVVGERFDNVFVTPQSYRAFLRTGLWPDKTMLILEVRASATQGSINRGGHYQGAVVALEAHVKDEARFPTRWGFFELGVSGRTAKPLPPTSDCQTCHAMHGAVDDTFVQFYPTLLAVAQLKGTFKATEK
jgi:hypothetical protein